MKTKSREEEFEEFVICTDCGHEQADFGVNIACEECGVLMPTAVPKE